MYYLIISYEYFVITVSWILNFNCTFEDFSILLGLYFLQKQQLGTVLKTR